MSLQVAIVFLVLFLLGCSGNSLSPSDEVTVRLDFAEGQGGWTAGFADYPVAQEEVFAILTVPASHRLAPTSLRDKNLSIIRAKQGIAVTLRNDGQAKVLRPT